LIGFHLGMARAVNAITSSISLSDGRGGKMWVPRARYSLIKSFWTVPASLAGSAPCRSATTMYKASSHGAVALMVIEVLVCASGMPSNSTAMSASEQIGTPTRPTSPAASGWSLS
jgi:hypothetical protein